jgi:hypothetical protein
MSKKLYGLIISLVGLVCAGAGYLIEYFDPKYAGALESMCVAIPPFVADVLLPFVEAEPKEKKSK